MKLITLTIASLSMMMSTMAQQTKPGAFSGTYPATKTVEQNDEFFGTTVSDPYRWLENDTAADTKHWVQQQVAVTQNYLGQIPFRDAIKQRLTEIWNYEKYSAPFKEGDYTYFFKNDGLQNQSVLYRRKIDGKPRSFFGSESIFNRWHHVFGWNQFYQRWFLARLPDFGRRQRLAQSHYPECAYQKTR